MKESEVRNRYTELTGLDDAGIKAFEDKVNGTIDSCLDYIDENKDADTTHIYEFIRDNYEGTELVLFASQMLSELLQSLLNERNSTPSMADMMMLMLGEKLEKDLATGHVAVKGDA